MTGLNDAQKKDKTYGVEPTNIDVLINDMRSHIIQRNKKIVVKLSRKIEARLATLLSSEGWDPTRIRDALRGVRNSLKGETVYYDLAEECVDNLVERLEKRGIKLGGGVHGT